MLLQHLGDDPFTVGGDADVALVNGGPLMGGRERLGGVGAAGVADRHLDPAVGEAAADGQPDPAGAAGDERNLPFHTGHVRPPGSSSPVPARSRPRAADELGNQWGAPPTTAVGSNGPDGVGPSPGPRRLATFYHLGL